jgi:UDP-N-acetylglucosamine 2-epimerase (non-hydrolysing)
MLEIDIIAGARPNFIKIASIIHAINEQNRFSTLKIKFRLIHTGQHYDKNMSGCFFEQLEIPMPDYNLGVGCGTQAEQTAAIMLGYEQLLIQKTPQLCLVVGDVTSSMACAVTAQKFKIKVAHVEAGIRSGDWAMPEEINRRLTDSITNYFFTTSKYANRNLLKSGVPKSDIYFVGNTMIDTLLKHRKQFIAPSIWQEIGLKKKQYFVLTLHRPSNVDDPKHLKMLLKEIIYNSRGLPIIFPVHPRTAKILQKMAINAPNIYFISPLSYFEFNFLVANAKAVITDSGGISEETTVLQIPCLTLRNSTERPETVVLGTNELLGNDTKMIAPALQKLFEGNWKNGKIPPRWDGNAGKKIAKVLVKLLSVQSEVNHYTGNLNTSSAFISKPTKTGTAEQIASPTQTFISKR